MDLTRKVRYVAGVYLTNPPPSITYVSVVRHDSVRLVFVIETLKYIDILAGKIQNTFQNSLTKYKVSFYAGDERKYDQGKVVIIVRALYGLKSSALKWRNNIYEI